MPSLKQLRRRSWAASTSVSASGMCDLVRIIQQTEEDQQEATQTYICQPAHTNLRKSQMVEPVSPDSEPAFLVTPMAPVIRRFGTSNVFDSPNGRTNQSNAEMRTMMRDDNHIMDVTQRLQYILQDGSLSSISSPSRMNQRATMLERRLSLSNIPNSPTVRSDDWRNESLASLATLPPASPAIHNRAWAMNDTMNLNVLVVKNTNNNNHNSINSLSLSDLAWIHNTPEYNKTTNGLENTVSTAMMTSQGSEDSWRSRDTTPCVFADLYNTTAETTATTATITTTSATTTPPANSKVGGVDTTTTSTTTVEECEEVETCPSDVSIIGSPACTASLSSWPSVSSVSTTSHHQETTTTSEVLELASCGGVAIAAAAGGSSVVGNDIPTEIEIVTWKTCESPKPKYVTRRCTTELPLLGLMPNSLSIPRIYRPKRLVAMPLAPRRRRNSNTSSSLCPSVDISKRREHQKEHQGQLTEIRELLHEWDEHHRTLLQEQECAWNTIQLLGRN